MEAKLPQGLQARLVGVEDVSTRDENIVQYRSLSLLVVSKREGETEPPAFRYHNVHHLYVQHYNDE